MARPVARRGEGRARVIDAALELFAEHGVSGTSLQMIADHVGVTKAAVYFQFQAKEDIVLAVVEPAFAQMQAFVVAAEAAGTAEEATDVAVAGLVDLIVAHRQVVAALVRDPEVLRIVWTREPGASLTSRVRQLLLGPAATTSRRVAASMLGGGLVEAGVDPQLADVADDELRSELLRHARLLLGVPMQRGGRTGGRAGRRG